jgi:hypothetical protein
MRWHNRCEEGKGEKEKGKSESAEAGLRGFRPSRDAGREIGISRASSIRIMHFNGAK